MDPLTSLSVAGSLVQLVDFGHKLLSSSVELYKANNGALRVNHELDLVAEEVLALASKLSPAQDLGVNFQKICDEAINVAKEIIAQLGKLKVDGKHRAWRSLQQAVNTAWTKDETIALVARLSRLRETIETTILVSLRTDIDILSLKVSRRFDSLDRQTQRIIVALLEKHDSVDEELSHAVRDQTFAITQILSRMEFRNNDEHRRTRDELRKRAHVTSNTPIVDVSAEEEDKLRRVVERQILESLCFSTMTTRCEEVDKAHHKTLEWVFHDTPDEQFVWSNFAEWLSTGEDIYWIKGKAGSGKSTLMKYIYYDHRTDEYLKRWAKDIPLCKAAFFFWNSGTSFQKSQNGLLQALLYEVLNEERKLIPIVLPWLWAKIYSKCATLQLLHTDLYSSPEFSPVYFRWSLPRLREAFDLLVKQSTLPLRLCLFVDGLDEFDGDHEVLSHLFKTASNSDGIKDLTRSDIACYVRDKLNDNHFFKLLKAKDSRMAGDLIFEITEKADGVFLWVKLAVRSLLSGLRNLDSISDLQARLRCLPPELDALYDHMFDLIEDVYAVKAAKIFQIVRATRTCRDYHDSRYGNYEDDLLSTIALYFAVSSEVTVESVRSYEIDDVKRRCEEMEVHLKVRCAGLLEVRSADRIPMQSIHYLHRTAREFIENTKTWQIIKRRTEGNGFNPYASMMKSCLFQILVGPKVEMLRDTFRLSMKAIDFAYYADRQKDQTHIDLLDQLNTAMIASNESHKWNKSLSPDRSTFPYPPFLVFAVQCDLSLYVQRQIATQVFPKNQRPLLEFVISRSSWTQRLSLSSKVANVLLDLKANPNQRFEKYNAWEQLLYSLLLRWEEDGGVVGQGHWKKHTRRSQF